LPTRYAGRFRWPAASFDRKIFKRAKAIRRRADAEPWKWERDVQQDLNRQAVIHPETRLDEKFFLGPLRVADLMTGQTITLAQSQSFADAVTLMASRAIHHVLIVDADERLRGVVSDRDVLRALSRTPDWSKKCIGDIMTLEPVTTTPDTTLSSAAAKMLERRINCLPVIGGDGRVCGILTSTDLLKAYASLQAIVEKHRSPPQPLPSHDHCR
jgi:CBS domain-containing protein